MPRFAQKANRNELQKYIESMGTFMPIDWSEYAKGAIREDRCVFCDSKHAGMYVYRYKALTNERQRVDGVYACRDCDMFIDQMLVVEHMDVFDKEYEEPVEEKSTEKNEKISYYNSLRGFMYDVHKYYKHLNPALDSYAIKDHCYFCETKIDHRPVDEMHVPVTANLRMDGGIIQVCQNCKFDLEDSAHEKHVAQLCYNCNDEYLVEEIEYKVRKDLGTNGKHLCPDCAYRTYKHITETSSMWYIRENVPVREQALIRHKTINCNACKNEIILDLTIDPIVYNKNIQNNVITCSTCIHLNVHRSNDNKVAITNVDKDTHIIIKKVDKYWEYEIIKIINNKTIVLKSAKRISKDPVTCTLIAYEAYEQLVDPTQLEIWHTQ